MRIAFDMDGVVADLHASYVRAALRLFPQLDRAAIATANVGASPPDDAADPGSKYPALGSRLPSRGNSQKPSGANSARSRISGRPSRKLSLAL